MSFLSRMQRVMRGREEGPTRTEGEDDQERKVMRYVVRWRSEMWSHPLVQRDRAAAEELDG